MPTIRTRQEPWRDLDVSEAEAANLGRMGLLLPEDEYPQPEPTPKTRAPRGAQTTPSEG